MSNDILIWGAGAIGGTVGAWLKRAGFDVTFVDIARDHVMRIRDVDAGLHISGPVDDFTVVAPAFTPEELKGKWQRIFLSVKGHHTTQATHQLAPFLAEDGYVLSLQNGLCEAAIADVVGADRTVGAFINFYADWLSAGEISYSNRGAAVIGELNGERTPRLAQLYQDLHHFEPEVIHSADIFSWLWGKLAYGSLLFAQAVGESSIAECLARPDIRPVLIKLASEVVQVADACGIALKGFNGFNPDAFRSGATDQHRQETFAKMVAFNQGNLKSHSGIWRDLAVRKRPTEVEGQLGAVIKLAEEKNIVCPTLKALKSMIHQIEAGERTLSDSNLNELLP